jgi:hypothetical protein
MELGVAQIYWIRPFRAIAGLFVLGCQFSEFALSKYLFSQKCDCFLHIHA